MLPLGRNAYTGYGGGWLDADVSGGAAWVSGFDACTASCYTP